MNKGLILSGEVAGLGIRLVPIIANYHADIPACRKSFRFAKPRKRHPSQTKANIHQLLQKAQLACGVSRAGKCPTVPPCDLIHRPGCEKDIGLPLRQVGPIFAREGLEVIGSAPPEVDFIAGN